MMAPGTHTHIYLNDRFLAIDRYTLLSNQLKITSAEDDLFLG